ncbi:MAG: GNAT family N-acetyltransferase [Alphaproteobacteria bacterium]|nr:GNAT family N-acetyltransferase [Alphaproteobacteria bacterium]
MFALAPFRLRPFRDHDAPRCARLLEEGWRDALPNRARAIDLDAFAEQTRGERIVVAAQGLAGVIGFVSVDHDFIHHLYVDRARRGRGVGAALLAEAVAMASGRASLKCALSNLSALEFYHRLGWTWGERGFDLDGPWVRLWSP